MPAPPEDGLSPAAASQLWNELTRRVELLIDAWQRGGSPPEFEPLLPNAPPTLRRLALVEFIKVDLEHRWARPAWRKLLEAYIQDFPELAGGELPCDLIYEEYHVRKQAGEPVTAEEYCARFPHQAGKLRHLLPSDAPPVGSRLLTRESVAGLEAERRFDDFDLLTSLGSGTFAQVFLARQRSLGRLVALKVSSDHGFEPQTLAQMDHPNIVRVFDQRLVVQDKLRLLYMEYVPGGTLQQVIARVRTTAPEQRQGRLLLDVVDDCLRSRGESPATDARSRHDLAQYTWPQTVCWLGARLAAALAYAHAAGVLHRDVKPANVLLAADASPKLADFNVSSCTNVVGAVPAASFGGSLAYMSPEQMDACQAADHRAADALDARSDLYSLGVLLWELLTGSRPFHERTADGLALLTLSTLASTRRERLPPAAFEQLPTDCPAGLVEVLRKCLQPDPNDRYASASDVAWRLELCLHPDADRLLRPAPRSWATLLRQRPLLAAVAAGAIPNLVGSGLNIAYNLREIVGQVEIPDALGLFFRQTVAVNLVMYGFGLALAIGLAWPTLRAVKHPSEDARELERAAFLRLGDYVAWIAMAEWFASGLIFPIWSHLELGTASGITWEHYVHFLFSHFLYGALSATLSFFCVTLLITRSFFPALAHQLADASGLLDEIARLLRRTPIYLYLACAVFPVAMIVIPLVNAESRLSFAVLGGVGLIAAGLAPFLAREIQRDASALETIVRLQSTPAEKRR